MRPDLDAIRARCEAATPGPWGFSVGGPRRDPRARYLDCERDCLMGDELYYPWCPGRDEDWSFIAAARADIPDLLDYIKELEAKVKAYRVACEEAKQGGMKQQDRADALQARLDGATKGWAVQGSLGDIYPTKELAERWGGEARRVLIVRDEDPK